MEQGIKIKCEKCGNVYPISYELRYQSSSDEDVNLFLRNSWCSYKCPECGMINIRYHSVYYFSTRRPCVNICYFPNREEIDEYEKILTEEYSEYEDACRTRLCSDIEEFYEKIRILEARSNDEKYLLFDTDIEVYKYILQKAVEVAFHEGICIGRFTYGQNNEWGFIASDHGNKIFIPWVDEIYNVFVSDTNIKNEIIKRARGNHFIDREWAMRFAAENEIAVKVAAARIYSCIISINAFKDCFEQEENNYADIKTQEAELQLNADQKSNSVRDDTSNIQPIKTNSLNYTNDSDENEGSSGRIGFAITAFLVMVLLMTVLLSTANNTAQKGIYTINGIDYGYDDSGSMYRGWAKIYNNWYFFSASGEMQKSCWIRDKYYVEDSGIMVTNAYIKNGEKYYWVDENGEYCRTDSKADTEGHTVYEQSTGKIIQAGYFKR